MRYWLVLPLCAIVLAGCGATQAPPPAAPAAAAPTAAPPNPVPTAAPTRAPSATALPTRVPISTPIPTRLATSTAAPTRAPTLAIPTAAAPTASATELAAAAGPVAPTAAPTAAQARSAPSDPVRLVINAITLDRPLIPVGLDERRVPIVPNHDVGWYIYSGRPGGGENIVLWGHVLRFRHAPDIPAPFARLDELAIGAELVLYNAGGEPHRYVVTEKVLATPDEVEYILPKGRELLTLVSCIGDKVIVDGSVEMTHRLITIAERLE
jgi:hypothetical protein